MTHNADLATPEELAGKEIRRLRQAHGWSQEEVSRRMTAMGHDLHQTSVGRLEAGQRPLRLNEAVALADLFGVRLDTLLVRAVSAELDEEELVREIERTSELLEEALAEFDQAHAALEDTKKELSVLEKQESDARGMVVFLQARLGGLNRAQRWPRPRAAGTPPGGG